MSHLSPFRMSFWVAGFPVDTNLLSSPISSKNLVVNLSKFFSTRGFRYSLLFVVRTRGLWWFQQFPWFHDSLLKSNPFSLTSNRPRLLILGNTPVIDRVTSVTLVTSGLSLLEVKPCLVSSVFYRISDLRKEDYGPTVFGMKGEVQNLLESSILSFGVNTYAHTQSLHLKTL